MIKLLRAQVRARIISWAAEALTAAKQSNKFAATPVVSSYTRPVWVQAFSKPPKKILTSHNGNVFNCSKTHRSTTVPDHPSWQCVKLGIVSVSAAAEAFRARTVCNPLVRQILYMAVCTSTLHCFQQWGTLLRHLPLVGYESVSRSCILDTWVSETSCGCMYSATPLPGRTAQPKLRAWLEIAQ